MDSNCASKAKTDTAPGCPDGATSGEISTYKIVARVGNAIWSSFQKQQCYDGARIPKARENPAHPQQQKIRRSQLTAFCVPKDFRSAIVSNPTVRMSYMGLTTISRRQIRTSRSSPPLQRPSQNIARHGWWSRKTDTSMSPFQARGWGLGSGYRRHLNESKNENKIVEFRPSPRKFITLAGQNEPQQGAMRTP